MAEKAGRKSTDDQLRTELAVMVSDLNEVRMRLDAVVRRLGSDALADGDAHGNHERVELADDELRSLRSMESLRAQLSGQLDRIREKLLARMPEDS